MIITNLILHFKLIGTLLITLALVHIIFPRYFNWKNELSRLSLINKEMMQVHTFFIALTVFLMGSLCLFFSSELTDSRLGKIISLGFGFFWFLRLMFQLFAYSSKLWKGKLFETIVHVIFSLFWFYLVVVFFTNWYIDV